MQEFFNYAVQIGLKPHKAGTLGSVLAVLPLTFLWAYVFRFAEAGVITTSICMSALVWTGYTLAPGYRGIFKPFILFGITLAGLLFGILLLPLFGSISALPPDSTEPFVLIFISFAFAMFLVVLIGIIETIYYAIEKRQGFCGVCKWK